ncbi:MAG: hypothetical protein KTR31_37865 [Myxococcales bacterium]|nr:hypothetical protein [Myxococcales bacterium]
MEVELTISWDKERRYLGVRDESLRHIPTGTPLMDSHGEVVALHNPDGLYHHSSYATLWGLNEALGKGGPELDLAPPAWPRLESEGGRASVEAGKLRLRSRLALIEDPAMPPPWAPEAPRILDPFDVEAWSTLPELKTRLETPPDMPFRERPSPKECVSCTLFLVVDADGQLAAGQVQGCPKVYARHVGRHALQWSWPASEEQRPARTIVRIAFARAERWRSACPPPLAAPAPCAPASEEGSVFRCAPAR